MADDYKLLAERLVEHVGGAQNVARAGYCLTRLRVELHDPTAADVQAIEQVPGVLGCVIAGDRLQIVIGADVANAYAAFASAAGLSEQADGTQMSGKADPAPGRGQRGFGDLVQYFASLFTPIIPAIVATTFIKCVVLVLEALGILASDSSTYIILAGIGDTALNFLPVLVALSVAEKLGCNKYVAVAVGCIVFQADIAELLDGETAITLLGLPVTAVSYENQVIPSILAVFCYAHLERLCNAHLPKAAVMWSYPLAVLVTGVALLVVFGPLGYFVGVAINAALGVINSIAPWLVSGVVGAVCPFLIMFGAHWAIIPIALANFATLGYDALLSPGFLVYNTCMAAVCFAAAIRTKSAEQRSISLSGGISAVLGISEPALYGTAVKLGRPFWAAVAGGFVGGCYLGVTGVVAYAWTPALAAIVAYFGETTASVVNALAGTLLGFAVSFVLTLALGFDEPEEARPRT